MDFSLVGKAISGVRWEKEAEKKFTLKSLKERLEFLENLRAGEEIYLIAGGLSREVAKIASQKGAKVALIPGTIVKKEKKKGETTALTLKRLSQEKPETFNIWLPEETEILSLTLSLQEWQQAMEERKATANRIRQDFYRKVLENPEDYKDKDLDELKEMAREEIEKDSHYRWIKQREQDLEKEVKYIVENMPLYKEVFADFEGCGPLIAARLIVFIRRIDRFESWEKLATYCGFGLLGGKKQRKRKGQSLGYNPQLKSAILYLWIKGQLRRWKRGELSRILAERIQKEIQDKKAGIQKPGTPTGRALWWMARKLIRQIYRRWKNFEKNKAP